jgi:hypothetical protein
MPYRFGEYVSTYVDPQSVKISETLRERFLSNFQANDQLTMAVEQMQAASAFENDVNRKRELQRQTENALAQLAERGDYENLGFQIHRTAKQFAKDYAPIEENYKRYQGALQEVSKAYEKGDVNAEYAQLYKNYMTRGYKGFEMDPETGRVKEGSMFAAPGIIKDPKVFDRIKKAIEIIKPEKYSGKSMNVAQGPDGMYTVTVEGSSDGVSKDVVQQAINMVMDEPDVKAYIGQMSDMQAYNLYSQGRIPEALQSQSQRISSTIDQLTKEIESGRLNTSTKKQYLNTVAKLRSELETINSASQDEQAGYQYVRQRLANDMFRPMEEFVLEAASYQNVSQSRMIDYDQKWLAGYKAQKDWEMNNPQMTGYTNVTTAVRDGATVEEQRGNMTKMFEASMAAYRDAEEEGISERIKKERQDTGKRLKAEALRIQQQIDLAIDKSIGIKEIETIDPTIITTLKEMNPNLSVGQLSQLAVTIFYNPQSTEFKEFENAFNNKYGNQALASHFKNYYNAEREFGKGVDISDRLGKDSNPQRLGQIAGSIKFIDYKFASKQIADKINERITNSDVSDKFKEIKTSTLVHYGALPGMTPEESRLATKAAEGYFKDMVIPSDMEVTVLGGKNIENWNLNDQPGDKMTGANLAGFKVKKYGFAPEYGENGGWELQLVDGDGKTATVMLDSKRVNSPQLQNYMNSNAMKFSNTIDKYNTRNKGDVLSFKVEGEIVDGIKADDITIFVKSVGDESPLIAIQDANGKFTDVYTDSKGNLQMKVSDKPIYNSIDSPQFKELVNSNIYKFY